MNKTSSKSQKRSSTSDTSGVTRSSPYSQDFEQKLIDEGIYLNNRSTKPQNWAEINECITRPRSSLSPSQFSDGAFERFREDDERAVREIKVMARVISTIAGESDRRYMSTGDAPFNHMEKFADGQLTAAVPDVFYGADPERVDQKVRLALGHHIVPSNDESLPAAPNFFLEAKSAGGRHDVGKRQACHDGAIGARGMHSLQNYGAAKPLYDNNAYTVTSTYHGGLGLLKMYATHPTEPKSPGGKPEYHMTPLRSFAMTNTPNSFRQGAAAYRSARDWSQSERDRFIANANEEARRRSTEAASFSTVDDSRARSSTIVEADFLDSDTSADELAFDRDIASKRLRKTVRSQTTSGISRAQTLRAGP